MTETGICEVIITGPTGDLIPDLARELVTARLAATANVFAAPVQATYWWQGKVETATETRIQLLTRTDLVDRIIAHVRQHHPYETPNITAVAILAGSAEFVAWVQAETVPTT